MKAPRFGIASRLILLTVALVVIGQVINAVILVNVEGNLRAQRAEAVAVERAVQALRVAETSRFATRRLQRRPGFQIERELPPNRTEVERGTKLLGEALVADGYQDRAHAVFEAKHRGRRMLAAAVQLSDGRWLLAGAPNPRGRGISWAAITLQTSILALVLILPAVWLGRAVAQPLRTLTQAADGFLTGRPAPPLPEGGPPDVQALCDAFAALEGRTLAALEERSVMLGSVGHDLRTPLASLRIRVEEIEDERLRDQMIDSIEGLAQTLDDILTFSKSTTGGTFEEVRSDALVRRLRAHYGEDVLTIGHVDAATITGAPESILRALRNLIDNASRFAGRAELSVRHAPEGISFCIDDDGPGLADDDLVRMQEPFTRAEGSRNRQDGGAGLGLAIARGVAEAHQGRLVLTNRTSGGLSAQFILPSSGDS
ncbi:hypothetical protein HK107_13105 [Parvularcula sp. ZS-1/3]|uniref:histidine kinase n=1 Tax=Parvularcula mediterranea TaxID=2732508 RepID=A0A7Y3RND0_9PROT|nr:hypothetical protein [Parvularcula mediterranea]